MNPRRTDTVHDISPPSSPLLNTSGTPLQVSIAHPALLYLEEKSYAHKLYQILRKNQQTHINYEVERWMNTRA